MISEDLIKSIDNKKIGDEIYDLIRKLFPICRSITGNGVRQTLRIMSDFIPIDVHEVSTGTQVFDWKVPKEWNVKDAYIKNSKGKRIVDFKNSNLHVLNYSIPVNKKLPLNELKKNIFTDPDHPEWIPYRTSYYNENWGFCMRHNQYLALEDDIYEVKIDSTLQDGYLTYGEFYIAGEIEDEILISSHVCHPSLCNDNLSGVTLSLFLARQLSQITTRYSYRFLYIPGTIGSITWLRKNEYEVSKIKHGLIVACIGDSGKFTYKKSRRGDAEIDEIVVYLLQQLDSENRIVEFFPYGYDERQFCSPGFNLPIGCLMRTPHGQYEQYHTSADNLDLVQPEYLGESFNMLISVLYILENNRRYINLNPKCEPQLGTRGLYQQIGGRQDQKQIQLALLWVLNLSDGQYDLLDIAQRSNLQFELIKKAADILLANSLLKETVY